MCVEGNLPLTILVQGGIASGKSTVAKMVAELGGDYVDCDRLAHEHLAHPGVKVALGESFGDGIFDEAGEVIRQALADIVFTDEGALARLEGILHPQVVAAVQKRIQAARTSAGEARKVVVVDAAVASRMKMDRGFDITLFVSTTPETRRRRAETIRGWSPGELERREARQAPLDSKQGQADRVVSNDGDIEEAKGHVKRFWIELVEPKL